MKAFIVLALVACAAARSLDIDTLRHLTEKSLLKDDLLLKEKLFSNQRFQLPKKTLLNEYFPKTTTDELENVDWTRSWNTEYPTSTTWGQRRVTVLSMEEIMSTSLFREYLNIPLFRQFWEEHPVVFRRYIESVLFQQFWTVPEFKQYFRNLVLFYKYIVPQVQIIALKSENIHRYNLDYPVDVEEYLNKNVYPESREVTVGDYLNKIFNHRGVFNTEHSPIVPYAYSRYNNVFGNQRDSVNYKFLLDKIYKTLFLNKPVVGEVTQVRTDVKVAPAHKEVVVEPITGETKVVLEEPKIVDVNVVEKIVPRTQVSEIVEGEHTIKEVLLKKLLLTKKISYEIYTVLKTLPLHQVREIVHRFITRRDIVDVPEWETSSIYGDVETIFPRTHVPEIMESEHTIKEVLLKKLVLTKKISYELYTVLKTLPLHQVREIVHRFVTRRDIVDVPEWETNSIYGDVETPFSRRHLTEKYNLNQLYNNELVGDRVVAPTLRELLTNYRQHTTRDVPTLEEIIRA